jgi:Cys-rich repeat protein
MMFSRDGSRMAIRSIAAAGTGLVLMLSSRTTLAVTFPQDAQWVPLTCNGAVLTDAVGEVQPPAIDVVGDASDPAAYVFMDTTSLFLRLRMNATAMQNANTFDPYAWLCLIRTPGTPGSYLVWDGIDGIVKPNEVELLQNTQPKPGNFTQQPANGSVATYGIAANARQVAATSTLGGNPNVYVDWAVALSDLDKVGIMPSTPLTFICGTSKTQKILDGDIVGDEQNCSGGVLDPVTCSGGACSACTTAAACGPSCTACGGATPKCNPAYGCVASCTSDAQCSGATPVCDTTRGVCVGCTSNASCSAGTTCNTASGLCVGCSSNANCPAGTYCDTGSATCTPCSQGASTCTGPGASSGGNVLANGSIEGGSCACDVVGVGASPGGLAGIALGIAAALMRRRTRKSRHRGRRSRAAAGTAHECARHQHL